MKEIKIETTLSLFDDLNELPVYAQDLMKQAVEAREKAYAPYSNFSVGASLLLDNGKIITGSNQENASYPSGLCAERVAVFYAGSKFPESLIKAMAISASSANSITNIPVPPCGACRQAIAEYEEKQESPIEVFFMGAAGKVAKSHSLENLLPFVFKGSML